MLTILYTVGRCPDCLASIEIRHELEKKMGLGHYFILSCNTCNWGTTFCSSKKVESDMAGRNQLEINLRTILAFREIGKGHCAMERFCSVMNMPPPMTDNNYGKINEKIYHTYKTAAEKSMQKATTEIIPEFCQDIVDTTVSVDGTWQKRGFSSSNDVVAAMSHGKCLDVEVLTKTCKQYSYWENKKDHEHFEEWEEKHKCDINHKGSSGGMESVGALAIFKRSVTKYNLRYTIYLGDGDSKSHHK